MAWGVAVGQQSWEALGEGVLSGSCAEMSTAWRGERRQGCLGTVWGVEHGGGSKKGRLGGQAGPAHTGPCQLRKGTSVCPPSHGGSGGVPGGMGRIPAMWATPRKDQRDHRERGIPGALELSQR